MTLPRSEISFTRDELEGDITARFKRVAAALPEAPAIAADRGTWSYAEVDRRCDQIAAAIVKASADRSGCVAFLVDHSAEMILCALAAIRAGKAYACIHPALPAAAQRELIHDALPDLLIADTAHASAVLDLASGTCPVLSLDDVDAAGVASPTIATDPTRPAAIFYTSGSTGRPKGVWKSHRAILHRAWLCAQYDKICPGDRQSLLTYCSFASSEADVFGSLLNGATVELFDVATRGIDGFATWINQRRITVLHPPVVMFRRFLATLIGANLFPSVRLVALAGEAVTAADVTGWRARFTDSCAMHHRFSSTEAGHVAVARIAAGRSDDVELSAAEAVADKHLSIIDEDGRPVVAGTVGELVVRSKFLAGGYWRNDEPTARKFDASDTHPGERTFRTGDLGRLRADGRFEFVGRRDNQVKIRGYRVELREIEQSILRLPTTREAAVVAESDDGETRLIAFVVLRADAIETRESIRAALANQLPSWKVPAEIVIVDDLPLTLTGKIDRASLLKTRPTAARVANLPENEDSVAAQLLTIWQRLLKRTDFGLDDRFLDLGGHSLMAAQLMHEIELRFGQKLSMVTLVTAPTIRALAELLRTSSTPTASDTPTIVKLKDGDAPPLFCLPPIFGTPLTYVPFSKLLHAQQPVYALHFAEEAPTESLQHIAAQFLEQIKTVQPRGPYRLCGYSYGGVMAYEIARQLALRGETVDFLGIFDGRVPRSRRLAPWHIRLWRRVNKRLRHAARRSRPRDLAVRIRNRLARRSRHSPHPPAPAAITPPNMPEAIIKARETMFRAATLQPYVGSLTLFRAELIQPRDFLLEHQSHNGWDALCRSIRLHAVAGDHLTMMQPPHLQGLASIVRLELARLSNA